MIQLQDFYRAGKSRYGLRVLTGTAGLTREFTWVHLCEDLGNVTFLRGGELVITTGLSAMREHWLADFLAALLRRQAAALIINVGKYIREGDIPPALIAQAAGAGFPIFLMPWSVHISDLMQETAERLVEQTQRERQTERLLAALACGGPIRAGEQAFAVAGEKDAPPVLLTARQKHALEELTESSAALAPFVLSVFRCNEGMLDASKQAALQAAFRQWLNGMGARYQLFFEQDELLLFRSLPSATDAAVASLATEEHSLQAFSPLLASVCTAQPLHGGTSAIHTALAALPAAYQEACAACTVASSRNVPVLSFHDLSAAARLFFTHPNRPLLARLAEERLGVLLRYDKQHHTQLMETLRQYLLTGGSLQKTAEATFTHRNTVNYRLHKIKELTTCELQDAKERFSLLLAYEITAFLRFSSKPQP